MERTETILVVDDDPDVRRLVACVLSVRGWRVREAGDVDAARVVLREGDIDLVLLDLTLRDRSGLDLLEEIRRMDLRCRVIIITGLSGLDPAVRSMTLGAVDYITKPFSPDYLLKSVEHALSVLPH